MRVQGVLGVDRPALVRALDDALRYGAPDGTEVRFERGIRSERAALSSGCDLTVALYAHGRRRRAYLSVRVVRDDPWEQPFHQEVGPIDLSRPDTRALRGWAARAWAGVNDE